MATYLEREEFLTDAASRAPGNEVSISVRDLLQYWNAYRRGSSIVGQVRRSLKRHKLTTEPNFEYGWIDSHIRLKPIREKLAPEELHDDSTTSDIPSDPTAGSLEIGALSAATRGPEAVVSVNPSSTLAEAQALMLRHDFSQLPVTAGPRSIKGAVSWESIAIQKMHNPKANLIDCIVEMHLVPLDTDLLPLIPEIIARGYIGVTSIDGRLSGIVTTADISEEFLDMAGPFLLIGECEKHLRLIVDQHFSLEEIRESKNDADIKREVQSAADLTFGELVRLFADPKKWDAFGWQAERRVFIAALEEARTLRNEIMHFSTDPVDARSIIALKYLVRWLKIIFQNRPADNIAGTEPTGTSS